MSDWYQQALTPPEVVELRIRIGVIPQTDHAQALVELLDPITGVQIAQASIPHGRVDGWLTMLDWATKKAAEYLGEALEPF
jgi:hypothetical protein